MNVKESIEKRFDTKPIHKLAILSSGGGVTRHLCLFHDGDYHVYWEWDGDTELGAPMREGRWRNKVDGKPINWAEYA